MADIVLSDFTLAAIGTLEDGLAHFVAQMAYRIADIAKDNLHVGYGVDTGAMQQSISAVTSEGSDYEVNVAAASAMNPLAEFAPEEVLSGPLEAMVQVPVHYAAYIEYGTTHMAAMPFLTPAAELVASGADEIAREIFDV